MEEIDKNGELECYGFNVSSVDDDETEVIVGHDSFEYNKAMLKGRPDFSKKAMAMDFEVENFADEFSPKGTDMAMFSENSDYVTNFAFNGANFLTSTVIEDNEFSPSIKRSELSDALITISAVELKLSSFVNDILNDLNKSKEILRQMENERSEQKKEKNILNPGNGFEKELSTYNFQFFRFIKLSRT